MAIPAAGLCARPSGRGVFARRGGSGSTSRGVGSHNIGTGAHFTGGGDRVSGSRRSSAGIGSQEYNGDRRQGRSNWFKNRTLRGRAPKAHECHARSVQLNSPVSIATLRGRAPKTRSSQPNSASWARAFQSQRCEGARLGCGAVEPSLCGSVLRGFNRNAARARA